MADSTSLMMARPDSWAARWNAERRERRAARREVTAGIDTRCVNVVMRRFDSDPPQYVDAFAIVAVHIACQTALTLGALWEGRRSMRRTEGSTFRLLGGLAVRADLSEHEVSGAAKAGVEGALEAARSDLGSGPWEIRTQWGVLDHLKAEAEAFAVEVEKELRQGMQSPPPLGGDKASVLTRLLDGRLPDDELGAAASAAGLDVSREHALVLLVHPEGRTEPGEAAAQDIEATISGAVDLGLTNTLPPSRRVVFPVLTHGRWIEARTKLHDIATRYGVLAIAPIGAPRLGALHATSHAVERDLARVVEGCGYTSGIIDPAGVGSACKAEGTSPVPHDEWALDATPASAA